MFMPTRLLDLLFVCAVIDAVVRNSKLCIDCPFGCGESVVDGTYSTGRDRLPESSFMLERLMW